MRVLLSCRNQGVSRGDMEDLWRILHGGELFSSSHAFTLLLKKRRAEEPAKSCREPRSLVLALPQGYGRKVNTNTAALAPRTVGIQSGEICAFRSGLTQLFVKSESSSNLKTFNSLKRSVRCIALTNFAYIITVVVVLNTPNLWWVSRCVRLT